MAKRQTRHKKSQAPALTRTLLQSRLANLSEQKERLARRAYNELSLVTPHGQATLAESDIPYEEMWAEVHWTDEAAERIRAGEFAYISPEFDMDHTDPGSGDKVGAALLAIGLVTRPFLKGMARVEDPDEDNVSHIQVFATGEWHHEWYGRITIEPRHYDEIIANADLLFSSIREESDHGATEMVVDYNHQSLYGEPDASKAAGWVRGKGLYVVKPEAAKVAASEVGAIPQHKAQGVWAMKDERVRELLKLSEGEAVTDQHRADVLELLDASNAELAGKVEELEAADDEAAGDEAAEPKQEDEAAEGEPVDIAQLREQAAEGAAAAKTLRERDARDAVKLAEDGNKLLPAQRGWAEGYALNDPQGFAAFVEGQPDVVPLGTDGGSDDGTGADAGGVRAFIDAKTAEGMSLADAQSAAQKQFGPEAFAEYRKPAAK